ncbi:MAG: hypothetical protein RLZZ210_787 [Pseudomonadota bacterium]|jgi:hypothetical protein
MTLTNNFSSMQVNACRSVLNDFSNGYKSDIKLEKIVTAQDVQNLKLDL